MKKLPFLRTLLYNWAKDALREVLVLFGKKGCHKHYQRGRDHLVGEGVELLKTGVQTPINPPLLTSSVNIMWVISKKIVNLKITSFNANFIRSVEIS